MPIDRPKMEPGVRRTMLAIVAFAAVACWCQKTTAAQPSVSDVLTKLHSRHWSKRIDAIEEIDADQGLLQSRTIQAALIDLLHQEVEVNSPDTSADDDGEEEYSQYLSSLCYIVNKFVDWNDPRQACLMVNAASVEYPSSPPEAAAAVARAAMSCILKRSKSHEVSDRMIAIPMLVEAIQKAQGTLDAETAQTARKIVLSDLRDDPDLGVRFETVYALGRYGGTDMIPALEEVVANDRSPEVQSDSIGKSAAKAILEIQKRASQN